MDGILRPRRQSAFITTPTPFLEVPVRPRHHDYETRDWWEKLHEVHVPQSFTGFDKRCDSQRGNESKRWEDEYQYIPRRTNEYGEEWNQDQENKGVMRKEICHGNLMEGRREGSCMGWNRRLNQTRVVQVEHLHPVVSPTANTNFANMNAGRHENDGVNVDPQKGHGNASFLRSSTFINSKENHQISRPSSANAVQATPQPQMIRECHAISPPLGPTVTRKEERHNPRGRKVIKEPSPFRS